MTRTTNARIAGFTYLFYIAVALPSMVLMNRATSAEGIAAKLARVAEHASDVRVAILLTLLSCFSAVVLGVALYGITRDQDHELAMLAMACRVGEGVLGAIGIPNTLGLLWLATAGAGAGAPDGATANALGAFLLMPAQDTMIGAPFFAVGAPSSAGSSCAGGWSPSRSPGLAWSRRSWSWWAIPCSSPDSSAARLLRSWACGYQWPCSR